MPRIASLLLVLFLHSLLSAQIQGPEKVGPGELIVLTTNHQGGAWMPLQPLDLQTVKTIDGGIAFSSGLKKQNIVIILLTADWENDKLRDPERIIIQVDGSPEPDNPEPDDPSLEGAALVAYEKFSKLSDAQKKSIYTIAEAIEKALEESSDWTGLQIIDNVNSTAMAAYNQTNDLRVLWNAGINCALDTAERDSEIFVHVANAEAVRDVFSELAKGIKAAAK